MAFCIVFVFRSPRNATLYYGEKKGKRETEKQMNREKNGPINIPLWKTNIIASVVCVTTKREEKKWREIET